MSPLLDEKMFSKDDFAVKINDLRTHCVIYDDPDRRLGQVGIDSALSSTKP
ncbi:MAG: hypothetical protein AAGE94_14780 [Acidobacteriota bacterium]